MNICEECGKECLVVDHIEYESSEFWGFKAIQEMTITYSACCEADVYYKDDEEID